MDFHQKKQKKVGQEDHKNAQPGDCYAYIAIKRDTNLHLAHTVGKRIDTIADHLVWKLSGILSPPTFDYPLEIYTDGNLQYLAYNNLMRSENGKTPMILGDKTSKIWRWEDFFMYH